MEIFLCELAGDRPGSARLVTSWNRVLHGLGVVRKENDYSDPPHPVLLGKVRIVSRVSCSDYMVEHAALENADSPAALNALRRKQTLSPVLNRRSFQASYSTVGAAGSNSADATFRSDTFSLAVLAVAPL